MGIFETVTIQILHAKAIGVQVKGLKLLLALSLGVEQTADGVAERRDYKHRTYIIVTVLKRMVLLLTDFFVLSTLDSFENFTREQ